MIRKIVLGVLMSGACAAGVAAQQQGTTPTRPQQGTSSSRPQTGTTTSGKNQSFVITGCVGHATMAGGGAGSSGTGTGAGSSQAMYSLGHLQYGTSGSAYDDWVRTHPATGGRNNTTGVGSSTGSGVGTGTTGSGAGAGSSTGTGTGTGAGRGTGSGTGSTTGSGTGSTTGSGTGSSTGAGAANMNNSMTQRPTELMLSTARTSNVDLSKYVGQNVEITGTLGYAGQNGSTTGSSAGRTSTGSTGSTTGAGVNGRTGTGTGSMGMSSDPTLTVTSVRVISPNCSGTN